MSAFTVNAICSFLGIDNPWHSDFKRHPFDPHGWMGIGNQRGLERLIKRHGVRVAVELGAWLGKSTRFMVDCGPVVVSVDTWEGSVEHHNSTRDVIHERLKILYDQFLSNCWSCREQIVPYRTTTQDAAEKICALSAEHTPVDLLYIDASHKYEDVLADLEAYWPLREENGAIICGDDWNWGKGRPVRRAVELWAKKTDAIIHTDGNFWWYQR